MRGKIGLGAVMGDNTGSREYLRMQVESASEDLRAFIMSIEAGRHDVLAIHLVSCLLNARRQLVAMDLAGTAQVQP